jgi:hypothetical protein
LGISRRFPFSSTQQLPNSLSEHFPPAIGKNQGFLSIFLEEAFFHFKILKRDGTKEYLKTFSSFTPK